MLAKSQVLQIDNVISKNLNTYTPDTIEIKSVGAAGLDNKGAELASPVPVRFVHLNVYETVTKSLSCIKLIKFIN